MVTGLRKRVTVGFLSIVILLFFSGMVSFLELSHLSSDTGNILEASQRNISLAKEMLDAVHDQNVALIHISVFGDRSYDSLCRVSLERLENTLLIAQQEAVDKSFLDSLAFATTELRLLTDTFMAYTEPEIAPDSGAIFHEEITIEPLTDADSVGTMTFEFDTSDPNPLDVGNVTGGKWYNDEYEVLYSRLTAAIKSYMTSTQSSLAPRAEQMKKNAYRAVTPVLISLAVMIAIVLMLYYFMWIYCVSPILRMNKGLNDFIMFRMPFAVQGELNDEMRELKEKIDSLVELVKHK